MLLSLVLAWAPSGTAEAANDSDPGRFYFLSNDLRGGRADETFGYGLPNDEVFVGDWNGDGTDTLGVRRGAWFYLKNDFLGGEADVVFKYGLEDDEVFVGDWNGDGVDTFSVRRGRTFYVTNRLRGGDAESAFMYGLEGDVVIVGDWDGDGDDTFGVRRGRTYFLDNSLRGGEADAIFLYGLEGDAVHVGDWDGDGADTLGVRRDRTYYLNNRLLGGSADVVFQYGLVTDVTLVGDWDGNGSDTLGVRRRDHWSILKTFEGVGEAIIRYDLDALGPVVAHITHTGSSDFLVRTIDEAGNWTEHLVDRFGDYSGTVAATFDYQPFWFVHKGFDIEADGRWRIVIQDARYVKAFTILGDSGEGDDVRRSYEFAGQRVLVSHSGTGSFKVWAVTLGSCRSQTGPIPCAVRSELLVDEVGPFEATIRPYPSTAWLEIVTEGAWSFAPRD
ncbi:MAG: hypothetical protein R3324_04765 [Halobacteriales archaeon]|nr:hypothetical protein [Halobacteriales archaeon]